MKHSLLLRSLMFVPGHNEKLLKSAAGSDADALILDLEDSVPEAFKEQARKTVAAYLDRKFFGRKPVFVRVNDSCTDHFAKDVRALRYIGNCYYGIVCPKVNGLLVVETYAMMFPHCDLVPLIEMTAAVLHVEAICRHPLVIAVAFGCEDYIADLQGIHSRESLMVPRSMIAMAARAAGITPIDTVHINVHDLDDLRQEAMLSRSLGFEGMLVLHPKELPIVHECFSPAPEEVRQASEMLRLSEEAAANGKGVAWMDGRFIGPPLVRQAWNILEKHRRIKELEDKSKEKSRD